MKRSYQSGVQKWKKCEKSLYNISMIAKLTHFLNESPTKLADENTDGH